MFRVRDLVSRIVALFTRRRFEATLDEELHAHLAMLEDDGVRAGLSRDEARRQARLRLGGIEQTKEAARDARAFPLVDQALQDLRYAVRTLARTPAFTAFAVVTLALGIGATTAVFTVFNGVLLRPLPMDRPDQVVRFYADTGKEDGRSSLSADNVVDLRARARLFDGIATYYWPAFNLIGREQTEFVQAMAVSEDFFRVLRARPALGRVFTREEYPVAAETRNGWIVRKTPPRSVILSFQFWQRAFGGDSAVIERVVRLGTDDMTVVGVMPREFAVPSIIRPDYVQQEPDCWVPDAPLGHENRRAGWASGIARLRDDVPLARGRADVAAIARQLEQEYPADNRGKTITLVPLRETLVGTVRTQMRVLAAAVACVLLIACANVTNLLLVRATGRRRELATRGALGASRARLVRQMLTETLLVASLGCAAGLVFAQWTVAVLLRLAPATLPRLNEIALDRAAFLFSAVVSLLAGVLCGLAPAMRASRTDVNEALKDDGPTTFGPRRRWLPNTLVVVETALALVLLIGAGLMARTFLVLHGIDPGFRPDHTITVGFNQSRGAFDLQAGRAFYRSLLDRLPALPGVEAAGVGGIPVDADFGTGFTAEGRADSVRCSANVVTEGYFRTIGISLVAGRLFQHSDDAASEPVVIVSRSLAASVWPAGDAIGKRVSFNRRDAKPWATVVGIIEDTRNEGLEKAPQPEVYKPLWQDHNFDPERVLIRTSGEPRDLLPAVRGVVRTLDKDRSLTRISTLDDRLSDLVAPRRFNLFVIGAFSALAFALALVGVYAVVSHTVAIRTREIGTRMILGASQAVVLKMIVRQNIWLILLGETAGLAMALGVNRVMRTLVFGVATTDAGTYGGVAIAWAAVALLACVVPARRAARIDPMAALKG